MSVDLRDLRVQQDAIVPMEFGGLLPSALGGATDRIERQGDRYSAQVTTPPMLIEPDGRRWAAKLMRARKEGAIIRLHQPDFNIGAPGTPTVATDTAAGKVIPLTGLTPNYAIREGQALNYVFDDQLYLDFAAAQVIANADGEATVTIQNLLRVPLTDGDSVILADPCIEGWIEGDFSIPRDTNRTTQFSFLISEKA